MFNPKIMAAADKLFREDGSRPLTYSGISAFLALKYGEGDVCSQNNLGLFYRDGLGVSADQVGAYKWLSFAGLLRNAQAVANLERFLKGLTGAEIQRG